MGLSSPRPRRYARLTAVAAAVVVVGAVQSASASADRGGSPGERRCEVLDGLREQTIRFESLGTGSLEMQVGDSGSFYDNIYDASGKTIGNVVGVVTAIYKNSDGHLMTKYAEAVKLPGGMVRAEGWADRTVVWQNKTVRYRAYGLTGKYAGKVGYREWFIPPPPPGTPPGSGGKDVKIHLKMVLCG
ncbi:hypothetical protein OHR68_03560 [Spirillospora sp. NBC_00431]